VSGPAAPLHPALTIWSPGGSGTLSLDHFGPASAAVGGVVGTSYPDNILFDIIPTPDGGMLNPVGTLSRSPSGFDHPTCLNPPDLTTPPAVQHP
jgi:hypothetical protein